MADRSWYYDRKANGQCVYYGCPKNCTEDSLLCLVHTLKQRATHRKYRTTKKGKFYHRAYRRRLRNNWRKEGRCIGCGAKDLHTFSVCKSCSERARDFRRAKRDATGTKTQHCSVCGQAGHKKQRHTDSLRTPLKDSVKLTLEQFATARQGE